VRSLAAAFRDTPLTCAVVGANAARRERSNRLGIGLSWRAAERSGRIWIARSSLDSVGAALLAFPPLCHPPAPAPLLAQLGCWLGQGPRVSTRWSEVARTLAQLHPPERTHWYLAVLGVDPRKQRAGIGSALVAALLRDADADHQAIYLETDRTENLAFYARFGFERIGSTVILGVEVHSLWRAPRV
jgi:ribosomal protein S18 acetylase RimI-like enzyme